MATNRFEDDLTVESQRRFRDLVESVGVKRFAASLNLTTRQVNRMLSGAQPNAIDRLIRSLQAAEPDAGDHVLDYICQEMGGHFVRFESMSTAQMNAVKECAEAIAAISDGQISESDIREIREAISALASVKLSMTRQPDGENHHPKG